MKLTLELSGGLELLFDNKKIHDVDIPTESSGPLTIRDVLNWTKVNLLKERPELFMKGDAVRPGILVLVNDCDWELSGMYESELQEGDRIVFISTLHGG